ncbi:unnamed protein product [Rhizophagus irregularis]|nr:unnamed protein product [Rhizophagus irregularis]
MGFIQLFVPNGTDWQIGEGGFGTIFSAIWSWGIETEDKYMHYRTGPCKVALKKLKGEMKITEAFLSEVQAQFDFCHFAPPVYNNL